MNIMSTLSEQEVDKGSGDFNEEDETTGEIAVNRVGTPASSLPTTWKQKGFPRQLKISNNNMKPSQGGPSFRYKLYCII